MPKKHALIIGINYYRHQDQKYQLKGCVNDAYLLENLLINKFNFVPEDITFLCDEAATRDAIISNMDALADRVEQDDIVVFHFSGHGHSCKVKTEFTDEGSGKINSIIPHDDCEPAPVDPVIAPEGKIWREIREHTINEWLQRLAKKTPYTTLIFDACHSGTMTRSAEPVSVRSLPQEVRGQVIIADTQRSNTNVVRNNNASTQPKKGSWLTLSNNFVVISGCRDTQLSKERYFAEGTQKYKHGVLTYSLCKALQNVTPDTTYRDLFEKVTTNVVSLVEEQNPQIEGKIDRVVFGVKDIEPLAFIPVKAVEQDKIVLAGGAAQGVRVGSKWAVYAPFTKQPSAQNRMATLVVTEVGAVSSIAELIDSHQGLIAGARCVVENYAYRADKLRIDLSQIDPSFSTALIRAIQASSLLSLVDEQDIQTADVYARIINKVNELPESLPLSQRQMTLLPAWAFYSEHESLCMPVHSIQETGVTQVLVDNLNQIARFRNIMQLDNPNTGLNVEFNLYKRLADDKLELANGGTSEFIDGKTAMVFEIKNNEVQRTVFFSLLWISAMHEVTSLYPFNKSSEELSPGKTVRLGLGNRQLTASLHQRFFADIGTECCKAIFSTTESDFSWLNQDGLRSNDANSANLAAFDSAFSGQDDIQQNPQAIVQSTSEWDAINRSFTLVRRPR
ncbi:caspase family protein [Aliiglaciecola litoralis]|uniref:Peptidase C14 caspase domain-containing protein n=1 Tax=Aliiglaciecola litoralis TaxID=582857 RepID=A0ABP3X759_9ALTE